MNETKTKNNNNKKIIIAVIAIALIAIIAFIFFNSTKNQKNEKSIQEQIIELENKEASLKAKKDQIYRTEGWSEEYYRLENEISRVSSEISELEIKKYSSSGRSGIFSIFPIITFMMFILVFIVIISTVIKTFKISKHQISNPASIKTTNDMEQMATMLGKVAVDMAKEMNPEYKTLHCPNCGADLPDDLEKCEYCDAPLTKVAATRKRKSE